MKINMPITTVEHALTKTDSSVTKTDLKGKITYAGEDFIQICGFSKNEDAQKLLQLHIDDTKQEFEASPSRYYNAREIAVILTAFGILPALWLSFSLLRSIGHPLNTTITHFGQIAQGNYNNVEKVFD